MTDIDFDELDKAVNSLMSKQRAAENKTDAGESTTSDASLASGNESSPEFAIPTVSSAENASTDPASAPVNNNVGGNIPVSVSHSSPVMQTFGNQSAEAPAAKIGTEAPKPSPNTEAEAGAVKVTTVPSVPVSSPTSSAPVAASVAGQPSVPVRSLTPSAPPVPSAATNVKPPTVSSAPAASSAPVVATSTSTTPSATTASATPVAVTAPVVTTNSPASVSSAPLSSSSLPDSGVTPAAQKPKPAASTVSISPASTTPAVPSAPPSSSSGSTVSSSVSPSGHTPAVTPAVSPPPAVPPEGDTVHVSPMIAKRPHGRFMDVVHPSSKSKLVQQRKMTPNTSKAGLVDQSGANPANTDDNANLADKGIRRPSMIGGGNNLNNIHSSESSSSVDTSTSANPEKSLLSSAKKRVVLPQNPEGKTNDSPDVATSVQSKSENTASVSPFISNVEVEKRPLGTPAAATDDANYGGAAIAKNDDHKKSLANYTPRKLDAPEDDSDDEVEPGGDVGLPPEFSADVMAAEEADVSSLDAAVDDIKAAEQRASKKPGDNDDASPRHSPKKDSTEPEPKPMFDAASRTSKNFDPKEESKSGWLTVLLILLFLAIGVAGGAAAYFLLIK